MFATHISQQIDHTQRKGDLIWVAGWYGPAGIIYGVV